MLSEFLKKINDNVYIVYLPTKYRGFPGDAVVKTASASAVDKRCRFNPCVRKIPWRRTWQSTTVFLPEESHGQRRLVDYSQKGCRVRRR